VVKFEPGGVSLLPRKKVLQHWIYNDLRLWLKFDAGLTSDPITFWEDQSGQGCHLFGTGSCPSSGKSAVIFVKHGSCAQMHFKKQPDLKNAIIFTVSIVTNGFVLFISKIWKLSEHGTYITGGTSVPTPDGPQQIKGVAEVLVYKDSPSHDKDRVFKYLHSKYPIIGDYQIKLVSLDVCIVLDRTSSMDPVFDAIIQQLLDFVALIERSITKKGLVSDLRLAFVGYTDHNLPPESYKRLDFSSDFQKIKYEISRWQTVTELTEGNENLCLDIPEDVTGGLNMALELTWKGELRHLILICDAPEHGPEFSDEKDYFPFQVHTFSYEDVIREIRNKDIHFTTFTLAENCNKMVSLFEQKYNNEEFTLQSHKMTIPDKNTLAKVITKTLINRD